MAKIKLPEKSDGMLLFCEVYVKYFIYVLRL